MKELIIDSFAGGGGASHGIHLALGRAPDIAINHDAAAIAMHAENHPETKHFTEDVWKLSPRNVTKGRAVGLLWASPDCTHFSRAKGGKPVKKHIRSLAWVVIKWAVEAKPRVIILENVREFEDWGPLVPRWNCRECGWRGTEGQAKLARHGRRACPRCESKALSETEELIPDPSRKGLTFRRWAGRLRNLGYDVQWKVLNAADYGAPTHRRRLFLIARRDCQPIVWPLPTHGNPKYLDDSPLFATPLKPWRTAAECIDWSMPCPSIFDRKRPLAEATMRRVALGIKRYVLDNPKPFLVVCNHSGNEFRGQDLAEPLPTVTASRDAHGIVVPYLVGCGGAAFAGKPRETNRPIGVIMPNSRSAVVAPTLIQVGYGERKGQSPRVPGSSKPLGAAVSGQKHGLVAAFLAKHYGGVVGVEADTPLPTTTARGTQNQLVAASLIRFKHDDAGVNESAPLPTATTTNHAALVYSFLVKYFGRSVGQAVTEPMHTVTGKDHFGLITVSIDGELFVIVDIGMRMLTPRELARGQGFPDSYIMTGTNTSQVARIGNSVPPVLAQVLAEANLGENVRVAV